MDSGQALGLTGIIIGLISSFIGLVNHKRIRSSCCGKKIETSFDIDTTTPPSNVLSMPYLEK